MNSINKDVNIDVKPSVKIHDNEWGIWIYSLLWCFNENKFSNFPLNFSYKLDNSSTHNLKLITKRKFESLDLTQPSTKTEFASIAIAILGAINVMNIRYMQLGYVGDGFDYYLYLNESDYNEKKLERALKLEISGVLTKKNQSEIKTRIKEKKLQCKKNPIYSNLKGYVAVSDFKDLICHLDKV